MSLTPNSAMYNSPCLIFCIFLNIHTGYLNLNGQNPEFLKNLGSQTLKGSQYVSVRNTADFKLIHIKYNVICHTTW